jgi:hypothetical protein
MFNLAGFVFLQRRRSFVLDAIAPKVAATVMIGFVAIDGSGGGIGWQQRDRTQPTDLRAVGVGLRHCIVDGFALRRLFIL